MAIIKTHNTISSISTARSATLVTAATRGGILLELKLIWKPRTFFDIGTANETINPGDIHVAVYDTGTSQTIFGLENGSTTDLIVVPTNGEWSWQNPFYNEILRAAVLIEKLAYSTLPLPQNGIIKGNVNVIAIPDPLKPTAVHDLTVEGLFLLFDANWS